jgi:(2Fe-2S) ferredoxin
METTSEFYLKKKTMNRTNKTTFNLNARRNGLTIFCRAAALSVIFCFSAGSSLAQGSPFPLGTIQPAPAPTNCPAGYTCSGVQVTCPQVANSHRGSLAIAAHTQGNPRGLVMLFTGGPGSEWWTSQAPEAPALADELRAQGFTLAQVKWSNSWHSTVAGNDAGPAHLGCRPATVIRYVYDNYYLPLGITPARIGQAGFCITGNSGGASQVSYALSHYGLENILNVVIPTGGPPHSALAKSMMNNPSEEGYWYPLGTRRTIDRSYGFLDGNGPGARQDPIFIPRWLEESVSTGGSDYHHPRTRVHFIIGEQDQGMQTVSSDYSNRLISSGSPFVSVEIAPGTPHLVIETAAGRAAFKAAILANSGPLASRAAFDFDGDGRADLAVFRPSDRVWYLLRSQSGFSAMQFGLSTDKIAPADFDGDGKTDIAVFRDGIWYWLNSSNGNFNAVQFGQAGDIPVPADYTGDGRAELAVYRGGIWYTLNLANNQFQAVQFGISSDKPVPADFDGDGKTDYAVYRDGVWYMLGSSRGFSAVQFGIATDTPTVGDYDGDGKADQAVYRGGVWYLLRSQAGFTAAQFGIASDIPASADYDGDGVTDIAVYRDGVWYMLRSTQGFGAAQFGSADDRPIPAAFVP